MPELVNYPQGVVAIALCFNQDADGIEVIDLVVLLTLSRVLLDLPVDAVDALGAAIHLRVYTRFFQSFLKRLALTLQVLFPFDAPRGQLAGDIFVLFRV